MPIINNTRSLQVGIWNDFMNMWRQSQPKFEETRTIFVYDVAYKKVRQGTYVFKESLPMVSPWGYGKGRSYQGFQDRQFQLELCNFELTIPYNKFDAEDDQLGDMTTHISGAVERYGVLPVILATEYFNGVAVYNMSLKNTYDGASIFSAVDGDGNDRLRVSGGNIISGTGITAAAILHDFAVAQQRFLAFLDPTAGLPIFDEAAATYGNMVAIIPNTLNEVFQKASGAELIKTDPANNTSESNYLKGTFQYKLNPFLTDTTDWYIVLKHPYYKPFIYSESPLENYMADMGNSDRAREFAEYAVYTHIRNRIGPLFPGCIIKVNN